MNTREVSSFHWDTPLTLAARYLKDQRSESTEDTKRHVDIIRLLLENGADVNKHMMSTKAASASACYYAVNSSSDAAFRLLLPHLSKQDEIIYDFDGKAIAHLPWYLRMMFEAVINRNTGA